VERIRETRPGDDMLIMMLSSSGQKEAVARCRDLGVSLYLTKPVRQSHLLRSITTALSVPAGLPDVAAVSRDIAKAAKPLRILLAEDNAVNQRVASSLLERKGHTVICACNGREAIARFDGEFDLVLMDVQMPEIGGFEATGAIRLIEEGTGRHVPIIAMTARAMKGDREECLAAGMDGYLSKPVRPTELYEALEELCSASASPRVSSTPAPQPVVDTCIDIPTLRDVTGGNNQLLGDLAAMFAEESTSMLEQIRIAVAHGDDYTLANVAHTLKGSAATMTGYAAAKLAAELEGLGRSFKARSGQRVYSELQREIRKLNVALEPFTLRKAG
jgi:CheY-like chemotaxis protein/HPt (histidine-containing phosphotransfer) domain-containing protein